MALTPLGDMDGASNRQTLCNYLNHAGHPPCAASRLRNPCTPFRDLASGLPRELQSAYVSVVMRPEIMTIWMSPARGALLPSTNTLIRSDRATVWRPRADSGAQIPPALAKYV
jgi:hypothetical protein